MPEKINARSEKKVDPPPRNVSKIQTRHDLGKKSPRVTSQTQDSKDSKKTEALLDDVFAEYDNAMKICGEIENESKQIKNLIGTDEKHSKQSNDMMSAVLDEYESAMKVCEEIEDKKNDIKTKIDAKESAKRNSDEMLKDVLSEYESALNFYDDLEVQNESKVTKHAVELDQTSETSNSEKSDSDGILESVLAQYESALKEVGDIDTTHSPKTNHLAFGTKSKHHIEDSALKLIQEIGIKTSLQSKNSANGATVNINGNDQVATSLQMNMQGIEKKNDKSGPLALSDLKFGSIIEGHVSSFTNFGAFVKINYDLKGDGSKGLALLHKSQVLDGSVKNMRKMFKTGEKVEGLQVIDIDHKKGEVGLSLLRNKPSRKFEMNDVPMGRPISGVVSNVVSYGAFVDVGADVKPLVHISKISRHDKVEDAMDYLKKGDKVIIKVISKNESKKTMEASMLDEDPSDHLERLIARRENESKHPWAREDVNESSDFEIANVASNDFEFLIGDVAEEKTKSKISSSEKIAGEIHHVMDAKNGQLTPLIGNRIQANALNLNKNGSNNSIAQDDAKSEKMSAVIARKLNEFIQHQHEKFVMKSNTPAQNI